MSAPARHVTWVSLADQRPGREQSWITRMPDTRTTVLSAEPPLPVPGRAVEWVPVSYRRPVRRFIEAAALAWARGLDRVPDDADWVASLECCSLVTGQLADLAARRPGLRQAVITWENDPRQPLYALPPYRAVLHRTLRAASLFVCMTVAAADHLAVLGVEPERIAVVRPGIDLELFRPAAEPVSEPVVVFASPLAPNKGIDRVLDAMRLVRKQLPEARLHVLGDGPLRDSVRRAAADPSSGVGYSGAADGAGVAAALRRAAVFCTAPRAGLKWSEQFGLAYLEAVASGLPVVTTATGTNHEAVPPGNLRTVDRADALADALVQLLADPIRRAGIGAANRTYACTHHDLSTQVALLAQAFAAAESRGRP